MEGSKHACRASGIHRTIRMTVIGLLAVSFACLRNPYPVVEIVTSMGSIEVEVYVDKAPETAAHFISHVEDGTYNSSLFYRVVRMDNQPRNEVKIEVIQGGLFDDEQISEYPVIAHENTRETGLRHTDGTVSMARNDPGSASTEFFICIGDQPSLDYGGDRNPDGEGFAAFGKVIRGMEVVRAIHELPDEEQYLVEKVPILEMQVIR